MATSNLKDYVSEFTKKLIKKLTEGIKKNHYACTIHDCSADFKKIQSSQEQSRIHAWSHYATFVCPKCSYYSSRQDTTAKHIKKENHEDQKPLKVDRINWHMLRKERPELNKDIDLTPTQPDNTPTMEEILLEITTPDLGTLLSPLKPTPVKKSPPRPIARPEIRRIAYSPTKPRLYHTSTRRPARERLEPYPTTSYRYISPERAEIQAMRQEHQRVLTTLEDIGRLYRYYQDEETKLHTRILRKEHALTQPQ